MDGPALASRSPWPKREDGPSIAAEGEVYCYGKAAFAVSVGRRNDTQAAAGAVFRMEQIPCRFRPRRVEEPQGRVDVREATYRALFSALVASLGYLEVLGKLSCVLCFRQTLNQGVPGSIPGGHHSTNQSLTAIARPLQGVLTIRLSGAPNQ